MIRFMCFVFLCTTCWLHAKAQNLEVSGSRVALPEGNILGAAFYEGAGKFFVQQNVLTTENGGLVIRSRRQLSSWGLSNRSLITKRVLGENQAGASAYPCGRVETSAKLRRVLICSAGSYVELIDPGDLSTVGRVAQRDSEYISDFAIDDLRSRLFVLTSVGDDSIRLTVYSLLDGNKELETVLPVTNATGMSLAFTPKNGQIGIAVDIGSRSGNKADIYTCVYESSLACTSIAEIDAVSQISVFGRQMLIATSTFADNKKDCVLSVDPATRSVSREYCSPSTGVHYAVGVVNNRYVVAFTGISKRKWLSEENKSVASSFSVWRAENPQVAAVAQDSTDYGAFQNEIRVVASRTEPLFIAYQRVSNVLCLYSIADHN